MIPWLLAVGDDDISMEVSGTKMRARRIAVMISLGVTAVLMAFPASAYEVVPVENGGTISGTISTVGPVPELRRFTVEKTPEVCGTEDRLVAEIRAKDGKLADVVEAYRDRVAVQTGGFIHRTLEDSIYTGLLKNGHIDFKSASVELVAMVTDSVRPGTTFSICLMNPKRAVNGLSPSVTDPMSGNYRFKLGVGKVRKVGDSPYKKDLAQMTFTNRTFS